MADNLAEHRQQWMRHVATTNDEHNQELAHLKRVLTFAYHTGTRRGEILNPR